MISLNGRTRRPKKASSAHVTKTSLKDFANTALYSRDHQLNARPYTQNSKTQLTTSVIILRKNN